MTKTVNKNSKLPSDETHNSRFNGLRAAVLGANDGIVSISSIAVGVAGATSDIKSISIAGLAALIAGSLSMAVGEYVSVSSQSDAEKAFIEQEKQCLAQNPSAELDELAKEYQKLGVSEPTAKQVAVELTKKDALRAHLQAHFNINPDALNSPIQASVASLLAFLTGGLIPFLAIILAPGNLRVPITVLAVIVALTLVGWLSAKFGNANKARALARVLIGGLLAMAITYTVGVIFGTTV